MISTLQNYLQGLFGAETMYTPVTDTSKLPVMYPALFQLYLGTIEQTPCGFAADRQAMHLTPAQIKKYLHFLSEKFQRPFVYVGSLSEAHAAERMIASRIPFIAPGHSLYLPFIGVVLGKKSAKAVIQNNCLGACGQLTLLAVLLKKLPPAVKVTEITELLPFGKSSVFTAFHELEYFGLGKEETSPGSRRKVFQFNRTGKKLWEDARDFLFNPCKRTVGISSRPPEISATIAGADALAQNSLLDEMPPAVFAMELSEFRKQHLELIPLNAAEFKIQLWLYAPCIFGDERIDPLSLALSLKNDPDERIQIAIESMLKEFPW